jgi:hypothetical protein
LRLRVLNVEYLNGEWLNVEYLNGEWIGPRAKNLLGLGVFNE